MFSHVMVGANDLKQSKLFYDAILKELGYCEAVLDPKGRYFYLTESGVFAITKPINGESATIGNGMTIGFKAENTEQVDAWHKAGLNNGGTSCEEPPGLRISGERKLYLAYLRDPSGNKICTVKQVTS